MSLIGAALHLEQTLSQWEGIQSYPHRFGGREFRLGNREIGHVHGNHLVDVPLPIAMRNQVIAEGLAQPHHLLPESGWVSLYLNQPQDLVNAVTLLQRSYQLALEQKARRATRMAQVTPASK